MIQQVSPVVRWLVVGALVCVSRRECVVRPSVLCCSLAFFFSLTQIG